MRLRLRLRVRVRVKTIIRVRVACMTGWVRFRVGVRVRAGFGASLTLLACMTGRPVTCLAQSRGSP